MQLFNIIFDIIVGPTQTASNSIYMYYRFAMEHKGILYTFNTAT